MCLRSSASLLYGPSVLAKVQYPDSEGNTQQFDSEVPVPPPDRYVFTHPDDGRAIPAVCENVIGSWQEAGSVAIYRADMADQP